MEMDPAGQQVTDTGTAGVIARPPLLFLAALLIGFVLDRLLRWPFPVPGTDLVHWIIGGSLILIGLALAAAGIRNFARAGTPVRSIEPARTLVTTGIHGWIRVAVPLLLLAAALLPLECTVPVRDWRTGESGDRPLPMVRGGPHVDRPSRVWIDTDAACNGGNADRTIALRCSSS